VSSIEASDIVTDAERRFPIKGLLKCEYFLKHRHGYYRARELNLLNPCRDYVTLLTSLREIHEYNERHARSFAKRFKANARDFKQCEAILAEIIVYRHYVRGIPEDLVRRIDLHEAEADVIVERPDGSRMFLEVFSVNPDLPTGTAEEPIVNEVTTHTQNAMASIRQKLLRKIRKQKQMSTPRENYAVIELNHSTIAGDFSALSSLSGGYEIQISARTLRPVAAGYDWSESIFSDPATRFLKGIIYFSLGDYAARKFLLNPQVEKSEQTPLVEASRRTPLGEPTDMAAFVNNPDPKVFDPDRMVSASEPFDVDEFIRTVHQGRDVEREGRSP